MPCLCRAPRSLSDALMYELLCLSSPSVKIPAEVRLAPSGHENAEVWKE